MKRTKRIENNLNAAVSGSSGRFMCLKSGDLILTGTPTGVGCFKKPPDYMKSVVKKKVMGQLHGHKQTGGGEPIEMNIKDWEEKVLATIPNVSVSGIEGGSTLVMSRQLHLRSRQERSHHQKEQGVTSHQDHPKQPRESWRSLGRVKRRKRKWRKRI
ncbi:hypothetical protein MAR_015706 [Mya arenaria]|uniref:Fumarylacetoacetase-like C-terminal domain-containing protein n=1 Tax=Mya arenaria TaxID=6604 RepID=A0ABY7FL06_MYAAR|nr:hypothetical protein MAR_015706 [Mya arenaria]